MFRWSFGALLSRVATQNPQVFWKIVFRTVLNLLGHDSTYFGGPASFFHTAAFRAPDRIHFGFEGLLLGGYFRGPAVAAACVPSLP